MSKRPTDAEMKLNAKVAAKERLTDHKGRRVPRWMTERGYTEKEIDDLMRLRREAFGLKE